MLRTRGIAARVVNGFLPGEYNEAADAYTVRQSDAHSWVEVYFPETQAWVTFDPTPAAGKMEPLSTGLAAQLGKYAEALELIWLQYVVGYDKQEQRALATSLHNRLFVYRRTFTEVVEEVREAITERSRTIAFVALAGAACFLLFFASRRVRRFGWRRGLSLSRSRVNKETSAVLFYERLLALLERRGVKRNPHLTPLEFAGQVGLREAMALTRAYNRVRFGREQLSSDEVREINKLLEHLEKAGTPVP